MYRCILISVIDLPCSIFLSFLWMHFAWKRIPDAPCGTLSKWNRTWAYASDAVLFLVLVLISTGMINWSSPVGTVVEGLAWVATVEEQEVPEAGNVAGLAVELEAADVLDGIVFGDASRIASGGHAISSSTFTVVLLLGQIVPVHFLLPNDKQSRANEAEWWWLTRLRGKNSKTLDVSLQQWCHKIPLDVEPLAEKGILGTQWAASNFPTAHYQPVSVCITTYQCVICKRSLSVTLVDKKSKERQQTNGEYC
jgi:hypothetical protein